jgi:hypothetical protein
MLGVFADTGGYYCHRGLLQTSNIIADIMGYWRRGLLASGFVAGTVCDCWHRT